LRGITRAPYGAPTRRRPARRTNGGTSASNPVRPIGALSFAAAALLALALPTLASATVAPPHNLLTFPQRDFVSASGYDVTHTYTVEVLHPTSLTPVGTVTGVNPVEDPATPGLGLIEVNHPGGACWVGTTPDIRAGDTLRIKDETTGAADTSLVRNVTAQRPVQTAAGTVQVHGTAQDAAGNPLPIAELEQRMVAPRDAFLANGRRTLRATSAAGSDGTLAYDPVGPSNPNGTNWTATYSGLVAADVTRALNAESRIMWIDPAVPTTESTIYENGAGAIAGPAAPCTAPLEKLPPPPGSENVPPSTPTGLAATVTNGNTVALTWTASTDNVGVTNYGVYRDGVEIATVQNADGSAPAPTTFTDRNVPPGAYTYTVDAGDAVGNRSGPSNGQSLTTARPVATLPAGTVVHDPPASPIQIISFPARDFISSTGFLASDTVQVQVLRSEGGQLVLVSSATQIPQQDPKAGPTDPFAGLVEVNHPGGACWDGATPDIRPGDIVRTIAYRTDGTIRTVDETKTANAVTQRPVVVKEASSSTAADGIIEVHGVAIDGNGDPLPADQIEQRLVANKDAFDFNGRRTLRAGGAGKDGTMSYDADDPTGTHWTARYTGLDANDIARAIGRAPFPGAESRILWLGSQPLAALELTIYENDGATAVVNGPAAPCTAPQEPLDTAPPTFAAAQPLTAAQVTGTADVKLTWSPASDDVAVFGYRVYRDGQPLRNVGPDATTFTDHNVVGAHTYQIDATDAASPGPGGNAQGTPWGNRSAKTDPVTVNGTDVTAPTVPGNLVARAAADGSVALTWTASKDDVGVTEYGVYRDGTLVGTAKNTDGSAPAPATFTDSGATVGTHTYKVDAADAAGNRSIQSSAATVNVTGTADTVAPSKPASLTATTPNVHVPDVKLTWPASTDNVGVTGYGVWRRRTIPGTTAPAYTKIADVAETALTYTDANVTPATYQYVVDAVDSAGNRSAKSAAKTVVVASDPPTGAHQLIAFPARDFLSTTGYAPNTAYSFSVIRGTTVFATSTTATSDAAGVVEVNHPGGACWNRITPNIRPGDVVRITGPDGVAEQTTVADITAERPIVTAIDPATGGGTVVVHGTAKIGANQVPVDQIEQRLVANKDLFDVNGRRTVRAGGAGTDGTLKYDSATSTRWTATYKFSTPNDLARAAGGTSSTGTTFVGAESRLLWLGRSPLAGNEQTIYENGPGVTGGPAAITGCTPGPAQTPVPNAALSPTGLTFGPQAVGTTSATQSVTLTNTGGAPMHVTRVYIAGLNPADFTVTPTGAATVAAGGSLIVKVAFKPKATGTRQANVSFADDAANTTDQTVPLVGGP
jgi:Abnormal spindle-like microcephaly-assoc'd, ASPM-SPD-2-Hydin